METWCRLNGTWPVAVLLDFDQVSYGWTKNNDYGG